MTVVGFNFSKLLAQHKKAAKGGVKISTNVSLDALEKTNLAFDNKRSAIKVSFTYSVSYEPAIGMMELQGDLLFMQENKLIEEVLKEWEEKKAVPKKLSAVLVNTIMQKCTIQSLIMARDIGLPAPIPLPKVKAGAAPAEKVEKKK